MVHVHIDVPLSKLHYESYTAVRGANIYIYTLKETSSTPPLPNSHHLVTLNLYTGPVISPDGNDVTITKRTGSMTRQ